MNDSIYKTPSSNLGDPGRHNDRQTEIRRYLAIACLQSPMVASLAFTFAFFVISQTNPRIDGSEPLFFVFVFALVFFALLAGTLVFLLPIHWVLGKLNKRFHYIYLAIGTVLPALSILVFWREEELSVWLTFCGTGALWFGMFWYQAERALKNATP